MAIDERFLDPAVLYPLLGVLFTALVTLLAAVATGAYRVRAKIQSAAWAQVYRDKLAGYQQYNRALSDFAMAIIALGELRHAGPTSREKAGSLVLWCGLLWGDGTGRYGHWLAQKHVSQIETGSMQGNLTDEAVNGMLSDIISIVEERVHQKHHHITKIYSQVNLLTRYPNAVNATLVEAARHYNQIGRLGGSAKFNYDSFPLNWAREIGPARRLFAKDLRKSSRSLAAAWRTSLWWRFRRALLAIVSPAESWRRWKKLHWHEQNPMELGSPEDGERGNDKDGHA